VAPHAAATPGPGPDESANPAHAHDEPPHRRGPAAGLRAGGCRAPRRLPFTGTIIQPRFGSLSAGGHHFRIRQVNGSFFFLSLTVYRF
jgi:hypothetical protein